MESQLHGNVFGERRTVGGQHDSFAALHCSDDLGHDPIFLGIKYADRLVGFAVANVDREFNHVNLQPGR